MVRLLDKREWMAEARRTFNHPEREKCTICNDFEFVTQAHHIVPLHMQADIINEYVPIHDIVWLCPTCHAIVHKLMSIDFSIKKKEGYSNEEIPGLSEMFELSELSGKYPFQYAFFSLHKAFLAGDDLQAESIMYAFYIERKGSIYGLRRTDFFDPIKAWEEKDNC